jgi:peptidoglycan LD-endopeptidase CwlK
MSNMHITTTQRTMAYLLLGSQLLTSCGINNTILPSKEEERTVQQEKNIEKIIMQEEPTQEEQEANQEQIVDIPTELAIDKKTDFFEFQAKGGYQVIIQEGASKAIVKETIGTFSREQELTIHNPANEDLKNLSQQGKLSQQYKVHVYPGQHVLFGRLGLDGGVKSIRVDVQEVIDGVKGGYGKLNRQAETLTAWMPFINAFTSALRSINFTLQLPSDPTTLNPGNIRDQFIQMTSQIMQRNVSLDNYGVAWYNLISQVRNQINREKHLDLDPAQYPLDSYSITLKPNADKMVPLIGEMDKLYKAKLNSNVGLDFAKILGFADVVVNFEGSFYEFEQKKQEELVERKRQEQEREQREKEEKLKREKEEQEEVPVETWDSITNARIAKLHLNVQKPAIKFINQVASELKIKLRVTQGLRTFEEQDALYAQGRTATGTIVTNAKGGQSYHNYGLAIDVVEIKDGKAIWDTSWPRISEIGISHGFEWGGNFKSFPDKPHFQMTLGYSITELLKLYNEGKWK